MIISNAKINYNSIYSLLEDIGLLNFRELIDKKLNEIGEMKYFDEVMLMDIDSYPVFNVFIFNPRPKSREYCNLERTYCSPVTYSETNYLHAIQLTNELTDRVSAEWFDIFELVLNASKIIYSRTNGYILEANQEKSKSIFSSEFFYQNKYSVTNELPF